MAVRESLHQEHGAEMVECVRHEGGECPRCDGSGYRPRKYCAGCGEPAGRRSEGGKALLGSRNVRGREQPMWCMPCHPEFMGRSGALAMFERMGA